MDFRNEKSAVQLTIGSSGITKLHFSECLYLCIFLFCVKEEERMKRANVPCSVFLVIVKHIQQIYLILLLFRSAFSLINLFRRQPACDTQFCTCVRSASGHSICIYIYTYIVSVANVLNEKTINYNPNTELVNLH